jgi:AcrR family transcriptional regulator
MSSEALKDPPDTAKRRQIMDGARGIFLEQGFDAASMGEIARRAGVSKGTLYVYFQSKEELFQAIFQEESQAQSERMYALNPADHDVEAVMTRLGTAFAKFLCQPGRIPSTRTIIAIAARMPDLGRRFYDAGPAAGIARLSAYLDAQVATGVLDVRDTEVAAAQFLDSCHSTMFKPMMMADAPPPDDARIAHVVGIAVSTFLAAYTRR